MNPRGIEPRKLVVDCTVAVEVTVQYDPLAGDAVILDVTPDWPKLRVGGVFWSPAERRTTIGVSYDVQRELERELPKRLEMRWNPKGP